MQSASIIQLRTRRPSLSNGGAPCSSGTSSLGAIKPDCAINVELSPVLYTVRAWEPGVSSFIRWGKGGKKPSCTNDCILATSSPVKRQIKRMPNLLTRFGLRCFSAMPAIDARLSRNSRLFLYAKVLMARKFSPSETLVRPSVLLKSCTGGVRARRVPQAQSSSQSRPFFRIRGTRGAPPLGSRQCNCRARCF